MNGDDLVFPIRLEKQLGTFKDQLHLLNASAVISMIVPVIVFFNAALFHPRSVGRFSEGRIVCIRLLGGKLL